MKQRVKTVKKYTLWKRSREKNSEEKKRIKETRSGVLLQYGRFLTDQKEQYIYILDTKRKEENETG